MRKIILYIVILAIGFGLGLGSFLLFFRDRDGSDIDPENLNTETAGVFIKNTVSENGFSNKQLLDFAYTSLSWHPHARLFFPFLHGIPNTDWSFAQQHRQPEFE